MSNAWDWWRAALTGEFGPIHEDAPQTGFYRMRPAKGAPWQRVAIWTDEDGTAAMVNDEMVTDAARISDIWTRCCRHPIASGLYDAIEAGGVWPDDVAEPQRSFNAAPEEQILEAINELAATVAPDLALDLVADGNARDRVSNAATRITELVKEADEARDREKRPHLEAGREVDARWRVPIDAGRDAARRLKGAVGDALKRIKAEAAEKGVEVATKAGTRGRTVSLRTVKHVRITDLSALANQLARFNSPDPEFLEVCEKIARRMLIAGAEVQGAELITEEKAA